MVSALLAARPIGHLKLTCTVRGVHTMSTILNQPSRPETGACGEVRMGIVQQWFDGICILPGIEPLP